MTAKRVGDFALYISIGVTIALGIAWAAMHISESGARIFGKWSGLIVNSLIVFGYTIRFNKPSWKRSSFWVMMLLLLVVHVFVFASVLERIPEWRITWWIIVTPVEYLAIGSVLVLVGYRRGNRPVFRP